MNKIKVLFVIENLKAGGAERVFVNLLKEFDKSKFSTKLLLINNGKGDKGEYPVPHDIEVINLNKDKRFSLFSITKTIKKEKPDIVFSNLAPINILCIMSKLIIRDKNIKFVIRETTIKSTSINMTKSNKLTRFIYKYLIKKLYNYADLIIALSEGAEVDLVNNFNVLEDKIKVIYNPIDIREIAEKSKEKIDDITINNQKINLVCVGSLVKSKGHKYLIDAINVLVHEKKHNIHAYFIGTGNLKEDLKKQITENNLNANISFLGYKSNPFKYIKSCDIFVLPAIWEGFGNVIVEAMACGVPVVSTNCDSGPREIITHNKNGLLAEPENVDSLVQELECLIINDELYNKIKNNGLKRCNDFEISKITREYEEYILSVLEK